MTTISYLTADELAEGDRFFTQCQVEDNRCAAGNGKVGPMPLDCGVPWLDHTLKNESGEITGYGLDYIKVKTGHGEVYLPWQKTGSSCGMLSNIYDFVAIGAPVTVDADRVFDKAYPWAGTNISLSVCKKSNNYIEGECNFVYNTALYNKESTQDNWSEWVDYTNREIGLFLGKGGWNLRQLLEGGNIDNTTIIFEDNPDCGKLMVVSTPKMFKYKVVQLIKEHFE